MPLKSIDSGPLRRRWFPDKNRKKSRNYFHERTSSPSATESDIGYDGKPAPLSYLVFFPCQRFDNKLAVAGEDRRPASVGAGAFGLGLDDLRAPDVTIT